MKTEDLILKSKIIVIVRRVYGEDLVELSKALYEGGIRLMEVTFDQSDPDCMDKTTEAISMLREYHGDKMLFGAGTVLSVDQVDAAYKAGAAYIISPNTNPDVIRHTRKLGLVSIPGAMTPSEILQAHECGANFVKLFPAATLGLRYAKDILAPISHVKLIATAGITEENIGEFLKLGFAGAGISGRLTEKRLIQEKNWAEFTERAAAFVRIAQQWQHVA